MPNYGVKHLNCVGGSCDKKWDGSGKNDEKVENVKKSIGTIASTAPWRSAVPEHLIDFIHRKRKRLLTDLTDFITSWTELRGYLPPRWRLYRSICVFLRIMGWDHFKVGFFFFMSFSEMDRGSAECQAVKLHCTELEFSSLQGNYSVNAQTNHRFQLSKATFT